MRPRALALSALLLLLGLIVQTTLIARFRFVTPDLMMLLAISFALTALRREAVLFLAFSAGLAVDMLSSTEPLIGWSSGRSLWPSGWDC